MAEGIVRKKNESGFGFILTPDGEDMFFHLTGLQGILWDDLRIGQRVSFDIGRAMKSPRAENIRPL